MIPRADGPCSERGRGLGDEAEQVAHGTIQAVAIGNKGMGFLMDREAKMLGKLLGAP